MWPFSKKAATLARPDADLFSIFGAGTPIAGQVVTPATALRCMPVLAAVRFISEGIASLPVQTYKRGADGARNRDRDHPAYKLLHGRANPWTASTDFIQQWLMDALLHGNGYALVVRAGGKPRELHRLEPGTVSIEIVDGEPTYVVGKAPGQVRHTWKDVLHLRGPISHDGIKGESPITLARSAIALAMALERHGVGLFGNSARPAGVISHPGKLSPEAFDSLSGSWKTAHTGDNAGGTAVLEEGAKWDALTFKSTDAQYLENRTFAITEIARAFGVPPHVLYELGRATWGNVEALSQEALTFGLLPWVRRAEAAITRCLIEGDDHYVEFLVDGFLRADQASRADSYSKLIAARVINANEARAREGLPPYPGGELFVNPNVTTGSVNVE